MSREAKQNKKQSAEYLTNDELLQHVPAMLESNKYPDVPKFPRRFIRVRLIDGQLLILEKFNNETVRISSVADVAHTLSTWARCNETHKTAQQYGLLKKAKLAKEHAENWFFNYSHNAIADLPQSVRFKSDAALCFHRLPFDLQTTVEQPHGSLVFPTWQSILDRMTNPEAFAMRVASMFDPNASRRQVVWLSGPANCGKSVVLDAIAQLVGVAYTSLDPSSLTSQFWKAPLVGKRLAVVNEATAKFLRTAAFKAVTGDDLHLINEKGKPQYTARIEALFFFASNDAPVVPGDDAIISRIIDCRIEAVPAAERRRSVDVRQELWNEMPEFISWAWMLYERHVGPDGVIPASNETLMQSVDEYEGEAMHFFHKHFVPESGAFVLADRVEELLRNDWVNLSSNVKGEWVKAWERAGVFRRRKTLENGRKITVYEGIRKRRDDEMLVVIKPNTD